MAAASLCSLISLTSTHSALVSSAIRAGEMRTALLIAAGVAGLAALVAMTIPTVTDPDDEAQRLKRDLMSRV